ncbi:glycosyltransferase family 25 protein [Rhizobium sp. SSA_523]|uniref:glycosyltransferase family 25 protein n=1 Tax=Rhizobium sp. SSA_523 TaxID=2952477 RepID=UPI002091E016|nr:glycosyltransferase family 25 protein [Rhizobium sp. SSA_523]MCO5733582.1 glycosyltransferase family 25 protein [Rhizobium sp. SSA_523]WKC23120.1 glycosyltransferase family 25 protein [Rhizobium sp. SSA_523]
MAVSHIDATTIAPGGRPLGLFAINLDRSADRWAHIEHGFGNLPWPLQRVRAVDARHDAQAVLAVRETALAIPLPAHESPPQALENPPQALGWNAHRNRLFMLTEEACLASHVLAWREVVASDFACAIILEDDAVPLSNFEAVVADLLKGGFPADIVKLEGIRRAGGRKVLPLRPVADRLLVRSLRPVSGAAAYLITRAAAETLLARIDKALIPVDDFLWAPSWHGLRVADVAPFVAMQSGAASVIATDRAAKQVHGRRPPFRGLLMALRRGMERLSLLWSACEGRPHALLTATMAPWVPDDYNLGNRTAVTAEDQRSSNG